MIHKYFDTGDKNLVLATFMLLKEVPAQSVHLVGEFNDWNRFSHPLTLTEKGHRVLTISLETNQMYEYRYLLDGKFWMTEYPADGFVPASDGQDNSIISTRQYISLDHDPLANNLPRSIPLDDAHFIAGDTSFLEFSKGNLAVDTLISPSRNK